MLGGQEGVSVGGEEDGVCCNKGLTGQSKRRQMDKGYIDSAAV